MSTIEENAALAKIANGATVASAGNAKARIGKSVVHVRYCSRNLSAPDKFKFNINPNTLSADYELWVCGSAALYYLMPIAFMAFTTTPTPTSTAAALACSLRAARSGGRLLRLIWFDLSIGAQDQGQPFWHVNCMQRACN